MPSTSWRTRSALSLLAVASVSLGWSCRRGASSGPEHLYVLYNELAFNGLTGTSSFPIRVFEVDSATGALADLNVAVDLEPDAISVPLLAHPSGRFLVAQGRQELRLLRIEDDGGLTLLPQEATKHAGATFHTATFVMNEKENLLYVFFPATEDSPAGMVVIRLGDGETTPFFERVGSPMPFSCDGLAATLDSEGRFLYCTADHGKVIQNLEVTDPVGGFQIVSRQNANDRVRKIVAHPKGELIYALSGVPLQTRRGWNRSWIAGYRKMHGGLLTPATRGSIPIESGIVDIAVTPDGRYLYGLDNPTNFVLGYEIGNEGELTRIPHSARVGARPLWFEIDPTGRFLYVGSEGNGELGSFAIKDSGEIVPSSPGIPMGGTPFSLAFPAAPARD